MSTDTNSGRAWPITRRQALALMGLSFAAPASLAKIHADRASRALRMVGLHDIVRITALCTGRSAGKLARTLLAAPPVPMQCEEAGLLKWRDVPLREVRTADIVVRLGGLGAADSVTSTPGSVQVDLRGLRGVGSDQAQLLALRDFAEGMNAGPWHLNDLEDLREIFGDSADAAAGERRVTVGVGSDPVGALLGAAGTSGLPPWAAATMAFATIAFHPGELRLKAITQVRNLVRDWLQVGAHFSYAFSETQTVSAGHIRVTVHSRRDKLGNIDFQELM